MWWHLHQAWQPSWVWWGKCPWTKHWLLLNTDNSVGYYSLSIICYYINCNDNNRNVIEMIMVNTGNGMGNSPWISISKAHQDACPSTRTRLRNNLITLEYWLNSRIQSDLTSDCYRGVNRLYVAFCCVTAHVRLSIHCLHAKNKYIIINLRECLGWCTPQYSGKECDTDCTNNIELDTTLKTPRSWENKLNQL